MAMPGSAPEGLRVSFSNDDREDDSMRALAELGDRAWSMMLAAWTSGLGDLELFRAD